MREQKNKWIIFFLPYTMYEAVSVFYIPSWKLSQCQKKKNMSLKSFSLTLLLEKKENYLHPEHSYQTNDDKKASKCSRKLRQIAELYSIYYGIVTVAIIKFTQMQWHSNNNIQSMEHLDANCEHYFYCNKWPFWEYWLLCFLCWLCVVERLIIDYFMTSYVNNNSRWIIGCMLDIFHRYNRKWNENKRHLKVEGMELKGY